MTSSRAPGPTPALLLVACWGQGWCKGTGDVSGAPVQSPDCTSLNLGLHINTEIPQCIVFLEFFSASPMEWFIPLYVSPTSVGQRDAVLFSSPSFLDNFHHEGCGEALDVSALE